MAYGGSEMLVRNDYRGCHRLYWELEDFEKEAPLATFRFAGRWHHLEFDGCVDDLIWDNLCSRTSKAVDIAELYEAVPLLEASSGLLAQGKKVRLDLSSGQRWYATQAADGHQRCVVLRSGLNQSATLTRDRNNTLKRLVLRTKADGILHEIKACPAVHGGLEAIAEAVTIYR